MSGDKSFLGILSLSPATKLPVCRVRCSYKKLIFCHGSHLGGVKLRLALKVQTSYCQKMLSERCSVSTRGRGGCT